jgi:signal transduction histidine kinase/CheY-like chemotaxis protein
MIGSHVNIDDLKRAELSLVHRNEVLNTISIANNHFVLGNDPQLAFEEILAALLRATLAPRGMLAGIRDYDGVRHFVIHATNNHAPELEEYMHRWTELPAAFVAALDCDQLVPIPLGCTQAMKFYLGCSTVGSCARILPVRSGTMIVGFVALCFEPNQVLCLDNELIDPLMATYASLIIGYRAKIEEARVRDELARRSDELERANAELEHANAMKDSFLANMSHELRSPLSTVIGVTEALMDGIYGDVTLPQRECITDASEAARHLLSLINDLLDLSRARLGEIDLYMEEFHIEDLLRSTMSIMRELGNQKGINLEFMMPKERVILLGDVRRIKQVFVNLLSNAIKFTPQGGYVTVSVDPDRSNHVVRIHVEDDGIGIPEQHLRHVFEPFTQIDSRLSRQHEGTGLGLPIVQRIVDLHGGIVEVKSRVGKGSTFTVVLPWEDVQQLTAETVLDDVLPAPVTTQPERRGMIYVVDDNAMNRRLLRDFAQLEGFAVREFSGGMACLDALIVSESPDVIVMDIQMPEMDGLETIRRIRGNESPNQHIPIVALTALVMPGDRELCLAAGADHYVTKPVEYKEFVRELDAMISRT